MLKQRLFRVWWVTSGVPQGSVLGPVLFLVCFEYVSSHNDVSALNFADNTKLYHASLVDAAINSLQTGIDSFAADIDVNKIDIAAHKTVVLRYETQRAPEGPEPCKIDGNGLQWVDTNSDLGITFGKKLKSRDHCQKMVNRANSLNWRVLNAFSHKDRLFLFLVFKTYICQRLHITQPCGVRTASGTVSQLNTRRAALPRGCTVLVTYRT